MFKKKYIARYRAGFAKRVLPFTPSDAMASS